MLRLQYLFSRWRVLDHDGFYHVWTGSAMKSASLLHIILATAFSFSVETIVLLLSRRFRGA